MASAEQDLDSFTSYARQKIESSQRDITVDELFDQWRAENPSDDLDAENLTAIRASIRDFKNGERGTIAGEHSAELRREFGVGNE